MQKVIAVNLGGNAYQVDDPGYQALRAYLDGAEGALAADPDRAEIVGDLERAIADKCNRFLGPHKNVVTAAEIAAIVAEMGPVDGAGAAPQQPEAPGNEQGSGSRAADPADPFATSHKRLYLISDGAWFAGVCNGIGAYFDFDPIIVRILFIVLTFLSGGFMILVYIGLMFLLPDATTPEEHAAAHGLPFNAQELVRNWKGKYREVADQTGWTREWKKQRRMWRAQRRAWRKYWHAGGPAPAWGPFEGAHGRYSSQIVAGALTPVFALLSVAVFGAFAVALVSLLATGTILDWSPPGDLPLWAAALILLLVYQVLAWPLAAARHAMRFTAGHGYGVHASVDDFVRVAFALVFAWAAYHYVPAVHDLVHDFRDTLQTMIGNLRESWR